MFSDMPNVRYAALNIVLIDDLHILLQPIGRCQPQIHHSPLLYGTT